MQIEIDYPVSPRPRWGHNGFPSHPALARILGRHAATYEKHLRGIVALKERLLAIPADATGAAQPAWVNGFLPGMDAAALYYFIATNKPSRYFEIGSGNSTRFARRAIHDFGLSTQITSIDPTPRVEIDMLCDQVVRSPVEEVDPSTFDELEAGDILFVDNSHRCFTNSDVTVLFLDVLPRLAAGVCVELHDIHLPTDYPPEWNDRFYSEHYVLAAALMGGSELFRPLLANAYAWYTEELRNLVAPLWGNPEMAGVPQWGASFWMEMTGALRGFYY